MMLMKCGDNFVFNGGMCFCCLLMLLTESKFVAYDT